MFQGPPEIDQLTKAVLRKIDVARRSLSRLLLKRMEHVHGFGKRRDVQNPMFKAGVNTDLADTGTNGGHRLPVVRVEPLLHTSELKAHEPFRVRWQRPDISLRAPQPRQRLVRHDPVSKFLYTPSSGRRAARLGNVTATVGHPAPQSRFRVPNRVLGELTRERQSAGTALHPANRDAEGRRDIRGRQQSVLGFARGSGVRRRHESGRERGLKCSQGRLL